MAKKNAPSVLALQRLLNITDGMMFSLVPDKDAVGEEEYEHVPVPVVRHGIRGILGTQEAHTNAGDSVSNIQITESAKLDKHAAGLAITFSIRPAELRDSLFSCNDSDYIKSVRGNGVAGLIDYLEDSESLREVCRRYARNIMNGRWMWRNRVYGKPIIKVAFADKAFSTEASSTKHFDAYTENERELGDYLMKCLSGGISGDRVITVEGRIVGDGMGLMEVYPSQNYTQGKPKGFGRPLYKIDALDPHHLRRLTRGKSDDEVRGFADTVVMGVAALRDQKIGNAIRTIDTWYAEDPDYPISIEPNGASLSDGDFHRKPGSGTSAYELLSYTGIKDMTLKAQEKKDTFDPELAYLIGILVRGGVYGESGKKKEGE